MDAFEHLVGRYFDAQGYWVRIGYKIDLTREEKRSVNNPSMPRPELDVVAFAPKTRELLIIECKSYLDSQGVSFSEFGLQDSDSGGPYKLFNKPRLRKIIFEKLVFQLTSQGALYELSDCSQINVRLGLACGKIRNGDESKLQKLFDDNSWMLITPSQISDFVRGLDNRGYENEVSTVVAKILGRNKQ